MTLLRAQPAVTAAASRPRLGRVASAAVALALLAACDEAVAPPGQSADVAVRVYLDRDASGSLTPADSGLAGLELTLTATDGAAEPRVASSDAQGLATFAAVAPGAYTITLPATAPAGTELTTSTAPRVVVSAIGAVQTTEVRYGWRPASVEGVIYRDEDGDEAFSSGDTPGAGLYVVLTRGTTVIDSVTADVAGRFAFPYLTPGSYELRLENPGTIDYPGGATRQITLAAAERFSVNGRFTGALVIPIAEARARAIGAAVAVIGNLVVRPGRFTSGTGGVSSEIWVQDNTGGIAAFPVPTADSAQYQLGDRLEIGGSRNAFSQQAQITVSRVRNLGAGTPVQAVSQSVAQSRAFTREGQLVRLPNVTVVSVPGGTGAAFTVRVADAAEDTIDVRIAAAGTGLTRANFVLGQRYTMSGVLSRFNATPQLKIRDAGDLVLGTPVTPIATVRQTGTNGTSYTITGRLTVPPGAFTSGSGNVNSELWVQDNSGGIAVFAVPTADSTQLALGDLVEVSGARGAFSGQLQLGSPTLVRIGAGAAVTPVSVTAAEVAARGDLEGRLVTLSGFTVTSLQTGTAPAFTVFGTVGGQNVQVRVGGPLRGLSRASFTVGSTYTVTGILTQFNGTSQIKVRFASDVTP
jgi:DNA/RNA endonuclease YhcR with UshA esterase domain